MWTAYIFLDDAIRGVFLVVVNRFVPQSLLMKGCLLIM
tara:strand:+ start:1336 stop:1449 length:114 start_codon:yes stop_codon:yes gene_type:complete